MDEKTDRNDKRIRDEKKDASARRISMVKRSDQKRALRRSQAEQREAILEEKLSRAEQLSKRRKKKSNWHTNWLPNCRGVEVKIYKLYPASSGIIRL